MPGAHHVTVGGVRIPRLVYGTAWKEDRTEALVLAALAAGFRGIDTANQRKHYHEAGVGAALREAFARGTAARDDLFLQTKFTYVRGQDHRLPYDPAAPFREQVAASLASSLDHLGVDRLDSYLLHGPWGYPGLSEEDLETWAAMEDLQRAGKTRLLGISNVTAPQLAALWDAARVKPSVVQNRTLTRPEADLAVRTFCREHGLAYEGFSLLTAAPALLAHPAVREVAARHRRTPAEVVLRFWVEQDVVVLTGTTSAEHMAQDVSTHDLHLEAAEVEGIARLLRPARG